MRLVEIANNNKILWHNLSTTLIATAVKFKFGSSTSSVYVSA